MTSSMRIWETFSRMSESFHKLYQFTPQTFSFYLPARQKEYHDIVERRLLTKPEVAQTPFQYSYQGAFWKIDGDLESYYRSFNQLPIPTTAKDLLKVVHKKQRLVSDSSRNKFFGPNDEVPDGESPEGAPVVPVSIEDEESLKEAIGEISQLDAFICSNSFYDSLADPHSSIKPQEILVPGNECDLQFWDERDAIVEPNTIQTLVDALRTLFTFSSDIRIYDTFIDPEEDAYNNFIEILKICGNSKVPADIKIITGPKRGSAEIPEVKQHEIAQEFVDLLNRHNQHHLNINHIDLQFWDYLHDRVITTFHGGFLLGQGLKDFNGRRDTDETRRTGPWNKEDVQMHDSKYDPSNSRHNLKTRFKIENINGTWGKNSV